MSARRARNWSLVGAALVVIGVAVVAVEVAATTSADQERVASALLLALAGFVVCGFGLIAWVNAHRQPETRSTREHPSGLG